MGHGGRRAGGPRPALPALPADPCAAPQTSSHEARPPRCGPEASFRGGVPGTGGSPLGKLRGAAPPRPRRGARLPAPGRGRRGGRDGGRTTPRGLRVSGPSEAQASPTTHTGTHAPATHLAARGSHKAGTRRRRLGMRAGDTEAPRSEAGARRKAASRGSCGAGGGSAAQAESVLARGCGGPRAVTYRRGAGEEGVAFAPRRVSRPAPPRGRGPRRGGPASGAESFAPGARDLSVGPRLELRLLGGQRRPAVVEAIARRARCGGGGGGALPSGRPRRPLRRRRRTHRAPDAPSPEVGSGPGSEAPPSCATLVASVMSSCHAGGSRPGAWWQGREVVTVRPGRGGSEALRNQEAHSPRTGWSSRLRGGPESRSHPIGASTQSEGAAAGTLPPGGSWASWASTQGASRSGKQEPGERQRGRGPGTPRSFPAPPVQWEPVSPYQQPPSGLLSFPPNPQM